METPRDLIHLVHRALDRKLLPAEGEILIEALAGKVMPLTTYAQAVLGRPNLRLIGAHEMGRPSVEEIEIRVKYNSQGEPTSVTYADGAGCGYEGKPTDLGRPIKDLVDYHLRHCRASHDIRPTIRCGYEVTGQDSQQRQVTLECVLEDHPSYAQHQLQIKS